MMDSPTNADAPRTGNHRSPNYPMFGLAKAIEKVGAFQEKARNSPIPVAIACEYLGVKITSSGGMRCISALQEFGLAMAEGKGKGKTLRVTETARTILKHPDQDSQEYRGALRSAALNPKIHKRLWSRYQTGGLPPDEALRYELESPKWGFSELAAKVLSREFRETLEFAGLTGGDAEAENGDGVLEEPETPSPHGTRVVQTRSAAGEPPKPHGQHWMPTATQSSKILPIPLPSGGVATLHLPYLLTPGDYDWMRTLIDGLKVSMMTPATTDRPSTDPSSGPGAQEVPS